MKNEGLFIINIYCGFIFFTSQAKGALFSSWLGRGLGKGVTDYTTPPVKALSEQQRLSIHIRHHFPRQTSDEVEKLREDLRQFLDSPFDILENHPQKILDSDRNTRRVYLSLVVSQLDPSNADHMTLFTDKVIGELLRGSDSPGPSENIQLGQLWEDVEISTVDTGVEAEDLHAGVLSALVNNNFGYSKYVMDNVSRFDFPYVAGLYGNPQLNLEPGNSGFMSHMMEALGKSPLVTRFSIRLIRVEEILFFCKYISIDPGNPAYREGRDFLKGRIGDLMKPPFVSTAITNPDSFELNFFREAAKKSDSLRKFVRKYLKPFGEDLGRIEKIKDKLSDLRDSVYREIMEI